MKSDHSPDIEAGIGSTLHPEAFHPAPLTDLLGSLFGWLSARRHAATHVPLNEEPEDDIIGLA